MIQTPFSNPLNLSRFGGFGVPCLPLKASRLPGMRVTAEAVV